MKYLLLILLLSGCNQEPKEVSLINQGKINLVIEFLPTSLSVNKEYIRLLALASSKSIDKEVLSKNIRGKKDVRLGFSYTKGDKCYIILTSPKHMTYVEFRRLAGHELFHCMFGKFHEADGKLPSKFVVIK